MFPNSIPTYVPPDPNASLDANNHTARHASYEAEIVAIETKIGTTGSADTNSHEYKIGALATQVTAHIANTSNPHVVTKSQVGLGNVDNTSDATKNSASATLTNKTIVTPIIASFINAQHNHSDVNNGGLLKASYGFSAYKSATGQVINTTPSQVVYDVEDYDINNNYASNVFTAPVSGYYHFDAIMHVSSSPANAVYIRIRVNGSTFKENAHATSTANTSASISHTIKLNSGDTVDIVAFCNTSSFTVVNGINYNSFSGFLIGTT